ncbi:MAG: cytochrome D1 domain-containing protein [Anaerolineales bacterium]|jgi:nitrite reductase (NO-forming)/hydroxylamine reductase
MNKKLLIISLGIILLAGVAGCSPEATPWLPTPTPEVEKQADTSDSEGAEAGTSSEDDEYAQEVEGTVGEPEGPVSVVRHAEPSIKALEVDQHTIFTTVGATITWHNDDDVVHNITSETGWFQADVEPGGTFTWQPSEPGVFTYHCETHDEVQGAVVVVQGGAVASEYYDGKPISKFFADTCGGCHGPNREGGTGPALIPGRLTSPDPFYFETIKNGRPGTAMPAWSLIGLSDEEIWGLIGFIRTEPEASDVQWGMEEIADTVEILVDEASLPNEPAHSGNIDNLMLVTEREARSIALIDADTHELLSHIEASYRAHGYAFDPTNARWAFNVGRDGWVFKIDLYTAQAVRKARVGHDSRGLAISDDGKYLIVGNYIPNSAVILNAETLEPLKVITTEGVNPDGDFVSSRVCITSDVSMDSVGPYFIIALKEAGQVWRIDYSDPDFPIDKVKNVGHILHDGFLSPDNTRFYLASQADNWMAVIDVENWELVDQISTGDTPHPGSGAVWEADGTTYGATVHAGEGKVTIWDLATNEIVGSVPTAGPGLFLRAAHNSPYVWADALFGTPSNTTTVFEKSAPFNVVGVIEEGMMTLHPEFTADGRFVYISDWTGNVVRVYDATTLEKVAEIGGVETPTGIFNTVRREEALGH